MQSIDILTDSDFVGERLDKYLQHIFPAFSRAALQKAIDAGSATVNAYSGRPYAFALKSGLDLT